MTDSSACHGACSPYCALESNTRQWLLFCFCVLLYCQSSDPAVPGNLLVAAVTMLLGWQMATASLLFLCCCPGQAGTRVNWSQRDWDLWMSQCGSRTPQIICGRGQSRHTSKCLWPRLDLCCSRYTSEGLRPKDKSMMEKVHPEAPVVVHDIVLEHLNACGHG